MTNGRGTTTTAGRPVWQALTALVLVPLLAASALAAHAALASASQVATALAAEREVTAVARLDAVRRGVDAELLPTLLVAVLQDPALARGAGFEDEQRAALLSSQPVHLAALRVRSDAALRGLEALGGPAGPVTTSASPAQRAALDLRSTATDTANRLVAARAAADGDDPDLARLAAAYQRISDGLAGAQGRASARALTAGVSIRTALALQDLQQVVRLGQLASRQLPLLLAARVTSGEGAATDQRAWLAAWGAYTELAGDGTPADVSARGAVLSTPALQDDWVAVVTDPAVHQVSALLDSQALAPERTVIATSRVPSAAVGSAARDAVVAGLLTRAARMASRAAADDAAAAAWRRDTILEGCAAALLVSAAGALAAGRWLTRASRDLAAAAERVSRGELVEVPERGPRELRTASRALSAAVAGLRRVQEQARLVVAGQHEAALRVEPLPGPLGRDVHAWTAQVVRSVQAREQLQEQVSHQAAHDGLTGLATRARVLAALDDVLRRDAAAGRRTGLLLLDLDGFKGVNEAHGHAAGDELLRAVAQRLLANVGPGDVVGRLGGDEFVVVVADAPHGDALVRRAARLVRAVREPVPLRAVEDSQRAGAGVVVGASVGVAITAARDAGPVGSAELLGEADTAAHRAKAAGRGRVELFDDDLRRELAERAETEQALRAALALGQLVVHYQPVLRAGAGPAVAGLEALLRWHRPGVGPVPTDDVIAVAERSSLVRDIGRLVLAEATLQLVRWTVAGGGAPTVSVNLSGRHLADPRVISDVVEALETSGLEPHRLVLEITETVLLDDQRAVQHLRALRAHGVKVAIDDFGTGFTSIAALATTPADQLKVDRSFVVTDDPARQQLLELTARAGRAFGLEVVAVGVETAEQLARAVDAGCTGAQGWAVAGVVPAAEVPALVASLQAGGPRADAAADARPAAGPGAGVERRAGSGAGRR